MITELTKEQLEMMSVCAKKWIDRFNSGILNRELAQKQLEWLYLFCGFEKPKIIFVDSPIAAQLTANILHVEANVRENVEANVWANVGENVRANVAENVRANVRENVRANVRENVRANVGANVRENVRANVWANVRANVRENYSFSNYGNISDYSWVSFYDYFFNYIGIENKNKNFDEFKLLIESGIYDCLQFKNICIAVSLPINIKKEKNKLHSSDSPAIIFGDGYSQYYWKGICVPAHWIEDKESISYEEIKSAYENAEKRRILIDILGVADFYRKLGTNELTLIDFDIDNNGNEMKLYSFPFFNNTIQMLECMCPSTGRIYNIAPPKQNSINVWDAKASICQITEKECKQLILES